MNIVFQGLQKFGFKTAIIDDGGNYSYSKIEEQSNTIANYFSSKGIEKGDRVAFLLAANFEFVATLFGVWKAGGIAVPLCAIHPVSELQYVVDDSQAKLLILGEEFSNNVLQINTTQSVLISEIGHLSCDTQHRTFSAQDSALLLYTSGTTNKPKGVVHTHESLNTTINSLIDAWKWSSSDHILHVLPLHHTHGLVNKLLCAMAVGATCEFLPKFDAEIVWNYFLERDITLFMAVPTIYSKLISYWDDQLKERQRQLSEGCKNLRLMVSGSAALPVPILEKWESISGHRLLERYGMTEIGMAISNPYNGERRAGFIGKPLPKVSVRLVDENNEVIKVENEQGEIQIKGALVFKEYWNKPVVTANSFTADGWFKTGDSAIIINGYHKILGRNSVDIIKSGGYKISALEIESKLLGYSKIEECAVVGIPDKEWGEVVAVAMVVRGVALREPQRALEHIQSWAKDKMAPYKIPRKIITVDELPRNVSGKIMKKEVKKLF
ncbi:MAG: acyl-CoA synthetase [Flavobacteriales bacterium]|nr:acyl-CoA synthetase [Flavobacteriales bacterium]